MGVVKGEKMVEEEGVGMGVVEGEKCKKKWEWKKNRKW